MAQALPRQAAIVGAGAISPRAGRQPLVFAAAALLARCARRVGRTRLLLRRRGSCCAGVRGQQGSVVLPARASAPPACGLPAHCPARDETQARALPPQNLQPHPDPLCRVGRRPPCFGRSPCSSCCLLPATQEVGTLCLGTLCLRGSRACVQVYASLAFFPGPGGPDVIFKRAFAGLQRRWQAAPAGGLTGVTARLA